MLEMSMNSFALWSLVEPARYFVSVNQKRKIVCPPGCVFRSKSKGLSGECRTHLSIFLSRDRGLQSDIWIIDLDYDIIKKRRR